MSEIIPILIALYTLLAVKTDPSPKSKSFERAGTSWLLVTRILTQDGLDTINVLKNVQIHIACNVLLSALLTIVYYRLRS